MGIFSLTQELAIDLGTANTLIMHNGKVVVDEPSIVALDVHTNKLMAIGHHDIPRPARKYSSVLCCFLPTRPPMTMVIIR